MVSASLDMLEESLVKKLAVLKDIEKENGIQKVILNNPSNVDFEAFDKTIDNKGGLIDQLNALDDGFQSLYDRVKADVDANREQYAEQIKRLQGLIHQITDMSASIEAQEHRNKKLAEMYFSIERQKLGVSRQSSSVAFDYYRTMNNFKDVPPQFLDKKN